MPERFVGQTLGRYRVNSLLGTGGFAWVYSASDPDLDVEVALKVLKPQYAGNPEFEQRFRREASTAARLKHPNIIKIYTVGRDGEAVYFAMDLYSQRLTQQIGVMGVLPESALLKLGLDVSSALGFAHRQGVIHRDIKADNILFDDHGNAIVADFGIARAASTDGTAEATGTNIIMGTPQFFSPEQARGQPTDARADIYSLGVTLFLAATGELPFGGNDWYEIATKHVQQPVPLPRLINPSVTPDMERVILQCLEKDREQRYATAEALYADLEAIARGRSMDASAATIMVSTPGTGRFQAIRPIQKEKPTPFLSAAVYLTAFALAIAFMIFVDSGRAWRSTVIRAAGVTVSAPGDSTDPVAGGQAPGGGRTGGAALPGGARSGGSGGVANTLLVSAPEAAAITVNGVPVGKGTWRADTLTARYYGITAQLPVGGQCVWGRDSTLADFSAGSPVTVVLKPQFCGSLSIGTTRGDSVFNAAFEVRSDSGVMLREGQTPTVASIVLPVGVHNLIVRASYCAEYRGTVTITVDNTTRKPVRLLCGER